MRIFIEEEVKIDGITFFIYKQEPDTISETGNAIKHPKKLVGCTVCDLDDPEARTTALEKAIEKAKRFKDFISQEPKLVFEL